MPKNYIDKLGFILIRNKRVLVVLSHGQNSWFIPGGKRNKGETDKKALVREVKEELSVVLDLQSIVYYGAFTAQAHGKPLGTMVKITCYTAGFTGELKAASEIERYDLFSYSQKPQVSAAGQLIFDDLKNKNLID